MASSASLSALLYTSVALAFATKILSVCQTECDATDSLCIHRLGYWPRCITHHCYQFYTSQSGLYRIILRQPIHSFSRIWLHHRFVYDINYFDFKKICCQDEVGRYVSSSWNVTRNVDINKLLQICPTKCSAVETKYVIIQLGMYAEVSR